MTLRELAEKKSEPRRLLIKAGPLPPAAPAPLCSQDSTVSAPGQTDRLLGTENLADIIPMFPPRGAGAEKEWEQASLLPAGNLGMILDATTKTGWLALSRTGMPPLLLYPLPVLGRLGVTPLEPLPPTPPEDESHLQTLHGRGHNGGAGTPSPPATAKNAG